MGRNVTVVPMAELMSQERSFAQVIDGWIAEGHEVIADDGGMMVAFLRTDDAEALLTDPRFHAVAMPTLHMSGIFDGPLYDLWSNIMFGKDGDEHRRIRGTVARFFTPKAIARHRPTSEGIARELVGAWRDGDVVDLWPAYALPHTARTACTLVGIPEADAMQAAEWALVLVKAFAMVTPEDRPDLDRAASSFTAYLDGLLADKRANPADDVASHVVTDGAAHLSAAEQRAMVANLIFGGLEAVTKGTLNGIFHLVTHDMWRDLDTSPDALDRTVLELLRFDPLAAGVFRYATEDVDWQGVTIRAGQMAVPVLRAVCKDPSRYVNADRLVLDRGVDRPYPFGAGPHFCLGYHLARLTIATALAVLRDRAPGLSIVDPDSLVRTATPFDGFTDLPVRIV